MTSAWVGLKPQFARIHVVGWINWGFALCYKGKIASYDVVVSRADEPAQRRSDGKSSRRVPVQFAWLFSGFQVSGEHGFQFLTHHVGLNRDHDIGTIGRFALRLPIEPDGPAIAAVPNCVVGGYDDLRGSK